MKRLAASWCLLGSLWFCAMAFCHADPLCFEAEKANAVTPPMRVVGPDHPIAGEAATARSTASALGYIEIPEGAGKPPEETKAEAAYDLRIRTSGDYVLWCRVWWEDGCGNSFAVQFDDTLPFTFGQDSTYKCWHWVKLPPALKHVRLTEGTHTLRIRNREDGIRIDQILLTTDPRFVPVDIEETTEQDREEDRP